MIVAEGVTGQVDVDRAGDRIGHHRGRGNQVVSLRQQIDTPISAFPRTGEGMIVKKEQYVNKLRGLGYRADGTPNSL